MTEHGRGTRTCPFYAQHVILLTGSLSSGAHQWVGWNFVRSVLWSQALSTQSYFLPPFFSQVSHLHHDLQALPAQFYSHFFSQVSDLYHHLKLSLPSSSPPLIFHRRYPPNKLLTLLTHSQHLLPRGPKLTVSKFLQLSSHSSFWRVLLDSPHLKGKTRALITLGYQFLNLASGLYFNEFASDFWSSLHMDLVRW